MDHVDMLLTGGDIVTMDDAGTVVACGTVEIAAGRIRSVYGGPPRRDVRCDRRVDATGCVVMPGLIDTHFHAAQQFLRGYLDLLARTRRLEMPLWSRYFIPFEAVLTPEDVFASSLLAYCNMLSCGTTCFAEAGGPHPEEMVRAMRQVGIRGVIARSTMDMGRGIPPNMVNTTSGCVEDSCKLIEMCRKLGDPRIRPSVAVRQVMVCSPDLIRELSRIAEDEELLFHTHLAEAHGEVDYCLEKWGKRPAEYLDSLGALTGRVHAAHSALLSDSEIALYADRSVSSAHCAFRNFAMFGSPKVPLMRRLGIPVGLGTDGAARGSLDLFRQMQASLMGQLSHFGAPYHDLSAIGVADVARMATIEGARALRWDSEIGSIEPGKHADIILVDVSGVDAIPVSDPLFAASIAACGRDVKMTIVEGQVVYEEGVIQGVDLERLKEDVKRRLPAIMRRLHELRLS